MKIIYLLFALLSSLAFAYTVTAEVYYTDGSASDVNAAIDASANGDIIDIPDGAFTWTTTVNTDGKAITIRGQGAGKAEGRSTTSWTPAVETKTFTVQSGLTWQAGDPIQIRRTGGERTSASYPTVLTAEGTVASYSGTSLQITVSSVSGTTSSAQRLWHFWRQPTVRTTITNNQSSGSTAVLTLTESTAGNVVLEGIRFLRGASATNEDMPQVRIAYTASGQPVIVRDCLFYRSGAAHTSISSTTNRGLIHDCSFVASALPGGGNTGVGVKIDAPSRSEVWGEVSTMGASGDPDGDKNLYVEDCDFVGYTNATDFDNNAKAVMRYCRLDHAAFGTHGFDTSYYGVRHYEVYNNTFWYSGGNDGQSLDSSWIFYLRGGTGVIYNNTIPEINGTDYGGSRLEINMTVMGLQRASSGNSCWGANIAGIQYPSPRQVGFGFVTGAGTDGLGNTVDSVVSVYVGDSEPLYYWGNTASGTVQIGTSNYGGGSCTNPDSSADYIVIGRDVITDGTAKPGWTAFTYPHPLRDDLNTSSRQAGRRRGVRIGF